MSVNQAAASDAPPVNRWMQLVVGIICMVMIANLQYGWSFFVGPMDQAHGWGRAAIQWAFFIFVFTETWLVPVEGWFVDKFGPRIVVQVGAVLVAVAWVINSVATTLPVLYFAAVVAGIGAGCVYGTCVGNALKWFADRRGLAAGLTAAGFGAFSGAGALTASRTRIQEPLAPGTAPRIRIRPRSASVRTTRRFCVVTRTWPI